MPCQYCDEYQKGFLEFENKNYGNRIIHETDNFYVMPSLGPLTEGHLLIVSKKHYPGVGGIPSELYQELESLIKKIKEVMSVVYSNPIIFEHGDTQEKGNISHVHIHVLPKDLDLFSELSKYYRHKKINSFDQLKEMYQASLSYIYYEPSSDERYLFYVPYDIPGGFIKKIIARLLGQPERWEWKVYPGLEEIQSSINKFKSRF